MGFWKRKSIVGATIGRAVDAVGAAGSMGLRIFSTAIQLPGHAVGAAAEVAGLARKKPGAKPGLEGTAGVDKPPDPGQIVVTCFDYGLNRAEERTIDDIEALLVETKPDWAAVRWINVNGLHPYVVKRFADTFGYHTLAAEDAVHTPQRPKAEDYNDHFFIIARMLRLNGENLDDEQVSFFLQPGLLVTFQQRSGDVWDPIRKRIRDEKSRFRHLGVGYLVYALLDAIVDHAFPILERYGDLLETMEEEILANPTPDLLRHVHRIKRELAVLRRVMWPTREVLSELQGQTGELFSDTARTFMRDAYEHAVQIIDLVETFRDMAGSLTDLYMSSVSNKMNEVMKVLTLIATIFIPITFLAGIYGMNFEHMPELKWKGSYPIFLGTCAAIVGSLLLMFRRKGWLGRPS